MSVTNKLTVVQAFDGAAIEEVPLQDGAQVEAMLARASEAFRDKKQWLPAYERIDILRRLMGLMKNRADDFALMIAREGGKPLSAAKVEVSRAINGVGLAIEEIGQLKGTQVPLDQTAAGAGRMAFNIKEPIGVVVAVSAFNHPLNLIVHQVVPAIATGCPVIVKPAARTPLSCLHFVKLVLEAGLPPAWCQACVCVRHVAEKLISDTRVAFFSFIGSAKVGWSLRSKLAPGTRCALEHGGVAPVIVAADADLERTVPALVTGAFTHAGQVCVSTQRIFVDRAIKGNLVKALVKQVGALKVGDPTDAATEVGPLIRPSEVERVDTWVNAALAAGAKCVLGGKPVNAHYYAPTILLDPPSDAKVSTEEIFGPVVCIYGYDHINDAIERANALPVSFQSAVFTQDIDRAFHAAKSLDAAAVMVNDHTAFRVDWMPFAGHRTSGLGVGGIPHTMQEMTQEKLIVIKT